MAALFILGTRASLSDCCLSDSFLKTQDTVPTTKQKWVRITENKKCKLFIYSLKRERIHRNALHKVYKKVLRVHEPPLVCAVLLVMRCHPPPPEALVKLCTGWTTTAQCCFYYWNLSLNCFLTVYWSTPPLTHSRNLCFQSHLSLGTHSFT